MSTTQERNREFIGSRVGSDAPSREFNPEPKIIAGRSSGGPTNQFSAPLSQGEFVGIGRISRNEPSTIVTEVLTQQEGIITPVVVNGVAVVAPKTGGCGDGGCGGCNGCKLSKVAENLTIEDNARAQEKGLEDAMSAFSDPSMQNALAAIDAASSAVSAVAVGIAVEAQTQNLPHHDSPSSVSSQLAATDARQEPAAGNARTNLGEDAQVSGRSDKSESGLRAKISSSSEVQKVERLSSSARVSSEKAPVQVGFTKQSGFMSAASARDGSINSRPTELRLAPAASSRDRSGASINLSPGVATPIRVQRASQASYSAQNSSEPQPSPVNLRTPLNLNRVCASLLSASSAPPSLTPRTVLRSALESGRNSVLVMKESVLKLGERLRLTAQKSLRPERAQMTRGTSTARQRTERAVISASRRPALPASIRVRTERVVTQVANRLDRLANRIAHAKGVLAVERIATRALRSLERVRDARGLSAQAKAWLVSTKAQILGLRRALELTRNQPLLRKEIEIKLARVLKESAAQLRAMRASGKLYASRAERPRLRILPRDKRDLSRGAPKRASVERKTAVRGSLMARVARKVADLNLERLRSITSLSGIWRALAPQRKVRGRVRLRSKIRSRVKQQVALEPDSQMWLAEGGSSEIAIASSFSEAPAQRPGSKAIVSAGTNVGSAQVQNQRAGVSGASTEGQRVETALAGGPKAQLDIDIVKLSDEPKGEDSPRPSA